MTESGWQAIGRIAKARRERMGLNQEDLADYGGPKVSTVGKFERAVGDGFPTRTQQQMERALGWPRAIVQQVVRTVDLGEIDADLWERQLVDAELPDLEQLRPKSAGEVTRKYLAKSDLDFGDPEGTASIAELTDGFAASLRFLQQAAGYLADDGLIYLIQDRMTLVYLEAAAAARANLSDPSTKNDYALAADLDDDAAGESESYNET